YTTLFRSAAGPTTWTAGVNDRRIRLRGWGAGGGGGGGAGGDITTNSYAGGGAGGGSPLARELELEVTPGVIYEILCGVGGVGGVAGTPTTESTSNNGGDGGD